MAILDADKEGFLRGRRALIQTSGRAARNIDGRVLLYADKGTRPIARGDRRDEPPPRDPGRLQPGARHHAASIVQGRLRHLRAALAGRRAARPDAAAAASGKVEGMTREEIEELVVELEQEMLAAAEELRFEYAAKLRDELKSLRHELLAIGA